MKDITQQEVDFCELYIYGGSLFSYKPETCYMASMEGMDEDDIFTNLSEAISKSKYIRLGKKLLQQKHIKDYIRSLIQSEDKDYRKETIKEMMIDVYSRIMIDASSAEITDMDDNKYVPAQQRAVAIQAGKALAELVPVRDDTDLDASKGSAQIFLTVTPHKEDE